MYSEIRNSYKNSIKKVSLFAILYTHLLNTFILKALFYVQEIEPEISRLGHCSH
jgi:hypothetical protein